MKIQDACTEADKWNCRKPLRGIAVEERDAGKCEKTKKYPDEGGNQATIQILARCHDG
jgi:hypothetical protein